MRSKIGAGILAGTMGVVVLGSSIGARQARQDADAMAALLTEVRGLRAAIEDLAATGPRVQLAMGRLQIQEQRIDTLGKRHTDIRDRRVKAEAEVARARQDLTSVEESARAATRIAEREEAAAAVGHFRRGLAQATAALSQLQVDEAAVAQDIATEQGHWSDISRRLEELDRALTRK